MTPAELLDEVACHAPARFAFNAIALRKRLAILQTSLAGAIVWIRRAWRSAMPWLAGATFVLAYLLVSSWLDRHDMAVTNQQLRLAGDELTRDKVALESRLAELMATRARKLIYLIEADTTTEAKEKLSRLAMMVAAEHFELQETTKGAPKK